MDCLVADCPNPGVEHMEIDSLGGHNDGWFCTKHAPQFALTWTRKCLRCGTPQQRVPGATAKGASGWLCPTCGGTPTQAALF